MRRIGHAKVTIDPPTAPCAFYLALARAAAHRGARRNGAGSARIDVSFPGAGFAPTRITVSLRGSGDVRLAPGRRPDRIEVKARATAELIPAGDLDLTGLADGGGYDGPLAHRQGKPTPHLFSRCRAAFRRCALVRPHDGGGLSILSPTARSDLA